ncbi:MAG: molybdenum cofactor guanylyltransferase [Candidatus Rokubacteria bacterium]|nr:molybdenum cofactor guanylyltransferase [Candidatus Rokubacteria bacterium]
MPPHVSGVILAGGKSRRMGGSPKALVPFGERPLIQHIVETLGAVLPDCLLVTNSPELYAFLELPMVGDVFPEGGSLGGIYSGLAVVPGEAALCVACDMPFLSAGLIAYLAERAREADVVIPDVAGELQPLHAVYGKACLPPMERRLRAGQLKVIGFFEEVRVLRIPEETVARFEAPALAFMNLNTPDDLARARELWAERSVGHGGRRA